MAQTVIGFFDTTSEAEQAVNQLVSSGFSRDNIDVSAARDGVSDTNNTLTGSTGTTGSAYTGTTGSGTAYSDSTTTTHDDDSHQSGIGRFFSSLFGSDEDDTTTTTNRANTYGQVAAQSDAIVTVHASSDEEAQRAADILDDAGAFDIDERAEQYGFANRSTDTYATPAYGATTTPTTDNVDANDTLKVIQEDLQVGKRTVETGGVRVRSRIVEKPVEESLRLREERVRIQRTPVNRVATNADLNAFQQGEISVTEHAEVPVVNKEARVVEEISVGKEVNERTETIRDTVRSTEVDVEDTTDVNRVNTTGTTGYTDTDVNRTTGTTGYSDTNTTPGTNL